MEEDEQRELKEEFAKRLLKEKDNPFKVALSLFPGNKNYALMVATCWPVDPVVLESQRLLLENEGEEAFLPSRAELAQHLWNNIQTINGALDPEGLAKLCKIYADIRGFIEKPQTNVNVNNISNRVMIVKEQGSDEAWEQKLSAQQTRLINASK